MSETQIHRKRSFRIEDMCADDRTHSAPREAPFPSFRQSPPSTVATLGSMGTGLASILFPEPVSTTPTLRLSPQSSSVVAPTSMLMSAASLLSSLGSRESSPSTPTICQPPALVLSQTSSLRTSPSQGATRTSPQLAAVKPERSSPPTVSEKPPKAKKQSPPKSEKARRASRSPPTEDSDDDEEEEPVKIKRRKRACERWTEEEDQKLTEAIESMGLTKWKQISEHVGTKDSDQCNQHWHRVLKPSINRSPWRPEEDSHLIENVKVHGESSWKKISSLMQGRTDTQCRHRWVILMRSDKTKSKGQSR